MLTDVAQQASNFVHANGIDIHYTEAGQGVPLVLVHGGMVSSNPIWTHAPVAYAAHMPELAGRYRVIAPDTRGCGQTVHDVGEIKTSVAILAFQAGQKAPPPQPAP